MKPSSGCTKRSTSGGAHEQPATLAPAKSQCPQIRPTLASEEGGETSPQLPTCFISKTAQWSERTMRQKTLSPKDTKAGQPADLQLLTVADVAAILGLSRVKVFALLKQRPN